MAKKYFRDVYGCTASLRLNRDGSATLKISDPSGRPIFGRCYGSERAAKIAMGKQSDGWTETKHD